MTYYTKLQGLCTHGESSDYNRADSWGPTYAWSPTAFQRPTVIAASTAEVTLDTTHFSTITGMMVENLSTTAAEIVRLDWYEIIGSQADAGGGFTFADDNPDTITDADTTNQFVVNGARVGDWVYVTGSTNNDGTHLIQAVAVSVITVPAATALTAEAAAAINLTFLSKNSVQIPDEGFVLLTGNIHPASNVLVDAASGTPNCRFTFFGT